MKKQMTRMAALVMTACLFTGCAGQSGQPAGDGGSGTNGTSQAQESEQPIERKEYTVVYAAELAHINYLKSSLSTCTRFTENYVDALVDFDKYGVTIPCLAGELGGIRRWADLHVPFTRWSKLVYKR